MVTLLTIFNYIFTDIENDDIDDGSLEENCRKASSEPSWGTSRLPPSIAGSKSVSPDKSPKKSPAKSPRSSASNTPDVSPVKVTLFETVWS